MPKESPIPIFQCFFTRVWVSLINTYANTAVMNDRFVHVALAILAICASISFTIPCMGKKNVAPTEIALKKSQITIARIRVPRPFFSMGL
jgi:hypothetical protein